MKRIDCSVKGSSLDSSMEGDTSIRLRTSAPSGERLDLSMTDDDGTEIRANLSPSNARILALAILEWLS